MRRVAVALALAAAATACAGRAPDAGAIQPWDLRERLRDVEVGQSAERARARLGRDPVHRPGRPGEPYPSPLRTLELTDASGRTVRVELYVVEAYAADGCAGAVHRSEPVAFANGAVIAVGWDAVEAGWRGWGGTLAALRDARDASAGVGACATREP